jgi:predicted RNase H-like HicB family nuclease
MIWPFGSPRGANGYVAVVPDIPELSAEGMDITTAIMRIETKIANWLAVTPPNARPQPADFQGGLCPYPPLPRLESKMLKAVLYEAEAIAKHGNVYERFWGATAGDIAECFTSSSGRARVHKTTIERWRRGRIYRHESIREARRLGWRWKP